MTGLWNICTNLFLPKPAQAEKTSNLGDQLAASLISNGLKSAWKHPITPIGRGFDHEGIAYYGDVKFDVIILALKNCFN